MRNRFTMSMALLASCISVAAQTRPAEVLYDEAKVPKYTLPDPLTLQSGEKVKDAHTWTSKRRPEILSMYQDEVFGHSPAAPAKLEYEVVSVDKQALAGKAVRKLVTLSLAGKKVNMLLYLPAGAKKSSPVFVALGFNGNQTVAVDPGVPLAEEWNVDPATKKLVHKTAADSSRGASAERWQVEKILAHGYGLATIYAGDIEPDVPGAISYGIRPLFFKPGQTMPLANDWGAIAAWAWGLSRAMDYLEKDRDVDAKRVAVFGHSRMGKTALWAGAQDTRFSLVISNESGEGGAAISRRDFGERTKDLNTRFPHWFASNFSKYNDREAAMPFDSHMLLALIAPRALYVASAEGDQWSDPRGEFLGLVNAGPVFELLGRKGLATDKMPAVHQPIVHDVAYHIRAGKHDVTAYDWDQYLKFADSQWQAK
ncbi:MAG TPA: hypothetical protein VG456_24650 [Candidatus Sulfopaludibacter sp.]|nr:hypothetical protein [Candidatus Sulfopaludibacter sp.]